MWLHLPAEVDLVEVGPRDGLQSLGRIVSVTDKLAMIERLAASGLSTIEVTGFGSPKKIPQFADAEALCARLPHRMGLRYRGMAPNGRGAERAVAAGMDEVVGLITASSTYLRKNQNMTMDEAVAQAIAAFTIADRAGRSFVMAIGLAFWCAYEGEIPQSRVLALVDRFHAAGIRRFYFAATVGLEDPVSVAALFARSRERWSDCQFGFHVHNLAGRASVLTLAAIGSGAQWVEGAICGIGGGIAMPGQMAATGNYATEDLVTLLADSGIRCGVEPGMVVAASRDIAELLAIVPRSYAGNGATRPAVAALAASTSMHRIRGQA
jgi:hydroxymethylglutaryl-CoA lyase